MVSGIDAAASGMIAQQYNIDVISNNLANANTAGFKELIPVFKNISDINISEKNKEEKSFSDTNKVIGTLSSGSVLDSTILDLQQGSMKKTDNNLDFAIEGKGFFAVGGNNGDCYTRNGCFSLNEEGTLVTKDGNPVLSDGGAPIKIDTNTNSINKINVTQDGKIFFDKKEVGKLKIVEFNNPEDLTAVGNALYKTSSEDIKPVESQTSRVNQGFIEGSNSNVIGTMINTISATRTYETLAKIVKTTEATLEKSVNDVGRVKE